MEWRSKAIGVRWFNDACYEIRLPDGKVILIDPFMDRSPLKKLDSSALDRVDYVLISHTHFDHVMDLDKILTRFQPQIFVGGSSGIELAKQYDIPGWQLNLCYPNDTIVLDGFSLTCLRSKHTALGDFDRPSNWKENLRRDGIPPEHEFMNMLGSYEYMSFLITLPGNLKFLIWGGGATPDAIAQVRKLNPNISIIQLPRESPQAVAALYAAAGGQFIFPHHHDSFYAKGPEGVKVIDAVIEKARELAPDTQVILPEKGEWYNFSTCLSLR